MMRWRVFGALSGYTDQGTRWLLVLLVGVMLFVTGFQVTSRYFFNYSIFWTEELVRYLFVWSAFFGGSLAFKRGTHLAIDLLLERIRVASPPVKVVVFAIYHGTILVSLWVVFYYGLQITLSNIPKLSIAMEISMALPYLCVPLGSAAMIIHHLAVLEQMAVRHEAVAVGESSAMPVGGSTPEGERRS